MLGLQRQRDSDRLVDAADAVRGTVDPYRQQDGICAATGRVRILAPAFFEAAAVWGSVAGRARPCAMAATAG
jgi:hypothetical protein